VVQGDRLSLNEAIARRRSRGGICSRTRIGGQTDGWLGDFEFWHVADSSGIATMLSIGWEFQSPLPPPSHLPAGLLEQLQRRPGRTDRFDHGGAAAFLLNAPEGPAKAAQGADLLTSEGIRQGIC